MIDPKIKFCFFGKARAFKIIVKFDIRNPDEMPLLIEIFGQMTTDKSPTAGNKNTHLFASNL